MNILDAIPSIDHAFAVEILWTFSMFVWFCTTAVALRFNYVSLQTQRTSDGNGIKQLKISVARTAARRSFVRFVTSWVGLSIGAVAIFYDLFPNAQFHEYRIYSSLYGLTLIAVLIVANEIMDLLDRKEVMDRT